MIRKITIGQYYAAKSPIHALDPRVKIALTFLILIALFLVGAGGYGMIAGLLVLGILLSDVPVARLWGGLRPLWLLLTLTLVLNIFAGEGPALLTLGPLRVTQAGLFRGGLLAFRLILLILTTTLLTLTTTPVALTDGIERILSPFRRLGVPAHELAMMMTIALRFIPTLMEETEKIIKAQTARGADFESGGLLQRAKSLIPILVPLFVGAFRRADELATAMEARCYRGGEGRTRMKELQYSQTDWFVLGMATIFITAVVILF